MWLDNLILSAWYAQKRQVLEWLQGDALKGAAAALQVLIAAHKLQVVKKHSGQHLKSNLLVLLAMMAFFGFVYTAIIILCRIIGLIAWDVAPPNLIYAFTWAVWIQVGFWSILLRYFFYRSTEECFYVRLEEIENDGLSKVQTWPENYSIMTETWGAIKRTLRYFLF